MVTLRERTYLLVSDSKFQFGFIMIGAFASFAPMFMNVPSQMEDSEVRTAIISHGFRESSFAILGLVLTHMLDFLVDLRSTKSVLSKNQKADGNTNPLPLPILTDYEKWVFSIGVALVPVLVLFPTSTPRLALAYCCCSRSQILLLGGYVIIASSSRYPAYFPVTATLFVIIVLWIVSVVQPWALNISRDVTPLRDVLFYMEIIGSFVFFACSGVCLYREFLVEIIFPRLRQLLPLGFAHLAAAGAGAGTGPHPIDESDARRASHSENRVYFPTVSILAAFIWIVFTAAVGTMSPNFYDTTDWDLTILNLPIVLFQITMMLLASQFSKYEIVENLYAMLDSKKSYVRYISHELRTPMNTACLGLGLLLDEAGRVMNTRSATPEEQERYEVLTDTNMACSTTVEILNDLLTFEKLQSGILELHTESVSALSLVKESIAMFAVCARSKDIEVVPMFDVPVSVPLTAATAAAAAAAVGACPSVMRALSDSDMVVLDKFKMSQVLRNLMSNALKFTPQGGRVAVKAYIEMGKVKVNEEGADKEAGANRRKSVLLLQRLAQKASALASSRGARDGTQGARVAAGGWDGEGPMGQQGAAAPGGLCEGRFVVEVIDSGAGISKENQAKLFREVIQFNPEKLQAGGGSGLGLFITKNIVSLHSGAISVYSQGEGYGTSFKFEVPMSVKAVVGAGAGAGVGAGVGAKDSGADSGRSTPAQDPDGGGRGRPAVVHEVKQQLSLSASASASPSVSASASTAPSPLVTPPRDTGADVGAGVAVVEALETSPTPALSKEGGEGCVHIVSRSTSAGDTSQGNLITLPPLLSRAPSVAPSLSSSPVTSPLPSSANLSPPSYRILVIDDSHLNRKMTVRVMRAEGHCCEEAEDGTLGVALIELVVAGRAAPYDVVLMDFVMPLMDGPTATREIRALGYQGRVYGLTGNALQSDIDLFMSAGADLVLTKPLDMHHFRSSMKSSAH